MNFPNITKNNVELVFSKLENLIKKFDKIDDVKILLIKKLENLKFVEF